MANITQYLSMTRTEEKALWWWLQRVQACEIEATPDDVKAVWERLQAIKGGDAP